MEIDLDTLETRTHSCSDTRNISSHRIGRRTTSGVCTPPRRQQPSYKKKFRKSIDQSPITTARSRLHPKHVFPCARRRRFSCILLSFFFPVFLSFFPSFSFHLYLLSFSLSLSLLLTHRHMACRGVHTHRQTYSKHQKSSRGKKRSQQARLLLNRKKKKHSDRARRGGISLACTTTTGVKRVLFMHSRSYLVLPVSRWLCMNMEVSVYNCACIYEYRCMWMKVSILRFVLKVQSKSEE